MSPRAFMGAVVFVLGCAAPSFAQPPDVAAAVVEALRGGRAQEALSRVEPLLAEAPRNSRLLTLKAMALAHLDRVDEALREFDAALAARPDFLAALQGAAELEYRSKRPGARARIDRVLAIDPGNSVAHAMAGALCYEHEEYSTALMHFRRAAPAMGRNDVALWQFAHCLMLDNEPREAVAVFQQLLTLVEGNAAKADPVRYNLALAYVAAGEHAKAIPLLEPLGQHVPPDADVLGLLADAYQGADRIGDAVTTLRRATTVFPDTELFYVRLGVLCLERESLALAREIAEIGLRHVPASAKLHAVRGIIMSQLGEYDAAQVDFTRAADLEPQQSAIVAGLSVSLQQGGREEDSIELLRRQTTASPGDGLAQLLLGQALLRSGQSGDLSEARQALERAVASSPNLASARAELGKLYLRMGRVEQAIDELQRAVSLDPADKQATYQLLVALRRAGRNDEARQLVVRVRTLLDEEKGAELARNRIRLLKAEPGR